MFVRPATGHAAHHGQRIVGRCTAMFARAGLFKTWFAVMPAVPVDRQDNVAHGVVDIGHDVAVMLAVNGRTSLEFEGGQDNRLERAKIAPTEGQRRRSVPWPVA